MKSLLVFFLLSQLADAATTSAFFWLETPMSEARLKEERALVRELEDEKGIRVEVSSREVTERELAALAKHHELRRAIERSPNEPFEELIEPLDLLVSGALVQKALLLTSFRQWRQKEAYLPALQQALALHPLGEFSWEGGTAMADVFEAEIAKQAPKGICQVSDLNSAVRVWANGFALPLQEGGRWVFGKGTFALFAEFSDGSLASQTVSCEKRGFLSVTWRPWGDSALPLFLLVSEGRWDSAMLRKGLGPSAQLFRYQTQTGLESVRGEAELKPDPLPPVSLRVEPLAPQPAGLPPPPEPVESEGPEWYNDWKVWSLLGGAALAGTYFLVKGSDSGQSPGTITFH